MTTSGIFISDEIINSLPQDLYEALLSATFRRRSEISTFASSAPFDEEDENFAHLSVTQVKELYAGCQEKTRKALEVIATGNSREFHIADVAKAIGVKPDELVGVWSGLTRRVRSKTVSGNNRCNLINWDRHKPILDRDRNYVDHIAEVSEMTYLSLRKLLVR